MRTSHYSTFLDRICGLTGIDSTTLSTSELLAFNGFFNKNIRTIWHSAYWLDNCFIESRTPDSTLLISFDQASATAIGEAFNVWSSSPYSKTRPARVGFTLRNEGIQLIGPTTASSVYIYYRKRLPNFIGSTYSSSTSYASSSTVYFVNSLGNGNYYTSNSAASSGQTPDTHASKWDIQAIPYTFLEYTVHASYADWLRSDGQTDKAAMEDQNAREIMLNELDKLERQQGQIPSLIVRTHGTSRP